jgi:uncharacterized SAM-binding protein YcdF (DUF218 family)
MFDGKTGYLIESWHWNMKSITRIAVLLFAFLLNDIRCTAGETIQADKTPVGTILVVLGNEPLDDQTPTVDMIARVKKAVEFHKANPNSLLILTGGPTVGEVSEARMMAEIAFASGVSTNSARLEERARSTPENASLTAKIVGTFNPIHILIVSKADHLSWAMPIFRKYSVFTNAEPLACTVDNKDSIAQMREYLVVHPENNRVRERLRQLLK